MVKKKVEEQIHEDEYDCPIFFLLLPCCCCFIYYMRWKNEK